MVHGAISYDNLATTYPKIEFNKTSFFDRLGVSMLETSKFKFKDFIDLLTKL
jgi:hypothetical protein